MPWGKADSPDGSMIVWNIFHVSSRWWVAACGTGRPRVGVIHRGLGHEIRTARHVAGVEDVVVLQREIRMKVGAGEPLADGPAVHHWLVQRVLRHRKGVHHVFDRLLIPGGGVGMGREHVGRNRQANHVPASLLGLGIARAPRGWLDSEKTIRLGRDDALDSLPQLGIQIVPDEPRSEGQRAGPHGRLPTAAPGLAVRALLRPGQVGGDGVANRPGRLAAGNDWRSDSFRRVGVFHERAARQHHARDGADALVHLVAAPGAPVAGAGIGRRILPHFVRMAAGVQQETGIGPCEFALRKAADSGRSPAVARKPAAGGEKQTTSIVSFRLELLRRRTVVGGLFKRAVERGQVGHDHRSLHLWGDREPVGALLPQRERVRSQPWGLGWFGAGLPPPKKYEKKL